MRPPAGPEDALQRPRIAAVGARRRRPSATAASSRLACPTDAQPRHPALTQEVTLVRQLSESRQRMLDLQAMRAEQARQAQSAVARQVDVGRPSARA